MATATFNGIEIPLLFAYETDRTLIADKRRTVLGKMRMDVVAVRREWTLETRPMPKTQRDALVDHLKSIQFQPGTFVLEDLDPPGSISVSALIRIEGEDRSVSHPDRRSLTLHVSEA